jgi:two-component system sensor histidine kinase/response regulator
MSDDRRIRILIAEDDHLTSQMLFGLLSDGGYEVVGLAFNGHEAISLTQALNPDLVLMDIRMPGMDGLTACAHIQQHCPTPVIVLTAHDDPSLAEQAAAAGAAAFLTKPPKVHELRRAIILARARFADMVELHQVCESLQDLNSDLDTYAQMVAHDLRHLLTPIRGYAEILHADYEQTSPEEARQDLSIIIQAVHDIDHLVDDLFLLANVRQKAIPLERLVMVDVVREALRRLDYDIQKKAAHITVPSDWPVVLGYMPWIIEVWINYLSNAIKYGGTNPTIELGWQYVPDKPVTSPDGNQPLLKDARMVRFWVRDYGVGIESENLPHVFEVFSKLGDVHLHGHGLGLSIARRIIEVLGGQVGVESVVNAGSTFSFTLLLSSGDDEGRESLKMEEHSVGKR